MREHKLMTMLYNHVCYYNIDEKREFLNLFYVSELSDSDPGMSSDEIEEVSGSEETDDSGLSAPAQDQGRKTVCKTC